MVPLSDGRGFLALEAVAAWPTSNWRWSTASIRPALAATQRAALTEVRQLLREWRKQGLRFEARSILVVEQQCVGRADAGALDLAKSR